MKKHLVVISVDAMVQEDVATFLEMSNAAALFRRRLLVKRMRTVYPSLTHPVHASIITGRPCGQTGIVHNERFDPQASPPEWYNALSDIRCETLFHSARRAGLKSGVARWPVTARGNDAIDYLIPEVLDTDLAGGKTMRQALVDGGAGPIWGTVVQPNLYLLRHDNGRPGYDAFSAACAAGMIRTYRPELLFTHWGMVDSARHHHGLFGPAVVDALALTDRWLGWLVKAVRDAGIFDQTDFVVLSDHGQLAFCQKVRLNALFAQHGLIQLDSLGRVRTYRALAHSCGMGAQIYLSDPLDEALLAQVRTLAQDELSARAGTQFEVISAREADERFGLRGAFSLVIETDGKTLFEGEACGPVFERLSPDAPCSLYATHGHMPDKGPQPMLLAAGPSFADKTLETGHVLEIAPTLARVLGIPLNKTTLPARCDWLTQGTLGASWKR